MTKDGVENELVVPDFEESHWTDTDFKIPGAKYSKVSSTFDDPMLSGYRAIVLNDSVTPSTELDNYDWSQSIHRHDDKAKSRLTTLLTRFPRCILSEVNTHRVFSRNSASSRARSMKTTITEVMEDPYIPLFTKNKRGMSGEFLSLAERSLAVDAWLDSRDTAVASVLNLLIATVDNSNSDNSLSLDRNQRVLPEDLHEETGEGYTSIINRYNELYKAGDDSVLSVHKQNANRLLEPFMWHEAIISSTEWENFFSLRDHEAAQPEIRAIAILMREAIQSSSPQRSWLHIPFKDEQYELFNAENDEQYSQEELLNDYHDVLMSASGNCARVSYKSKIDTGSVDSAKLGNMLLKEGHMSPFEHIAFPREAFGGTTGRFVDNYNENWVQFRTLLENN